ncbi:hypothetical protein OSTOST_16288 [Ostertagia ostertagi]
MQISQQTYIRLLVIEHANLVSVSRPVYWASYIDSAECRHLVTAINSKIDSFIETCSTTHVQIV